jgi:hypothetical protein
MSPAHLVETCIGRNAIRPRGERRPSIEVPQPPHERDERFLRRIESIGIVARHTTAQAVEPVVVAAQQGIECRAIAVLRGGDEGYVVVNGHNLLGGHLELGDLRMDPT